jgi:GTP pyrophosphokinase
MNTIHESAKLAWSLHYGQTRANGQPYIYHPMRVAGLMSIFGDDAKGTPLTDDMVAAAWLHDVYEDTNFDPPALNCINPVVEKLVDELTNRFTKEARPKWDRKKRKDAEQDRIAYISPAAQVIKLCDRLDNLDTIRDKKGKGFHALYCDETQVLLEAIPVAPFLHSMLYSMIDRIRKEL